MSLKNERDVSQDFVIPIVYCQMPIPATVVNAVKLFVVDPATIASLVKAALEIIKEKNFMAWQDGVTSKLDEISQKLDQVITELQRLRGYIDERITKESIDLFEGEINARRRTAEQILAGIDPRHALDKETESRLIRLMDELDVPLWQLMNWRKFSFDSYSAVIVGVLTKLLLLSVTRRPAGEAVNFAQKAVASYFSQALDMSVAGSIEAARNTVASNSIQKSNEFVSYLSRWWHLSFREFARPGHDPDHTPNTQVVSVFGYATGSLDAEIAVTSVINPDFVAPWYPRVENRENYGAVDLQADLRSQRQSVLDLLKREGILRDHENNVRIVAELLNQFKMTNELSQLKQ